MATVRDIIRETCQANDCPELCDMISYSWSNKMTKTFGLAAPISKRIKISRKLWAVATYDQKATLVAHEACHIIAYYMYNYIGREDNTEGHGPIWRNCMDVAGYSSARYHDVPVIHRRVARVTVYCDCGEITVTKTRRTKMLRGHKYSCNTCYCIISPTKKDRGYVKLNEEYIRCRM